MIRSRRVVNKKVCILGARAVGKSSLVRRYLSGSFDSAYAATIGANISKTQLRIDRDKLQLMLWDVQGGSHDSDSYFSYLKGVSAIVYVVDGTRFETLDIALAIRRRIESSGERRVPSMMLFNKSDLTKDWQISSSSIGNVESDGMLSILTSCREGTGVDTAFDLLSRVLLGKTSVGAPESG